MSWPKTEEVYWPPVDKAIVSMLTSTDGMTLQEIHERFQEAGAPYMWREIRESLCWMAAVGKVSWCRTVHLQKRGVTG